MCQNLKGVYYTHPFLIVKNPGKNCELYSADLYSAELYSDGTIIIEPKFFQLSISPTLDLSKFIPGPLKFELSKVTCMEVEQE